MGIWKVTVAVAVVLAGAGACGSGGGVGPTPQVDAGPDATGDAPASTADRDGDIGNGDVGNGDVANGQCNQVVDDGPISTYLLSTATPPSPMGGTIVSGTYDLTVVNNYWNVPACFDAGMPPGGTGKYVVTASSDTAGTIAFVAGDGAGREIRESARYAVSGTNITLTIDCAMFPDAGTLSGFSSTAGYTATATELHFFATNSCGTTVSTIVKR